MAVRPMAFRPMAFKPETIYKTEFLCITTAPFDNIHIKIHENTIKLSGIELKEAHNIIENEKWGQGAIWIFLHQRNFSLLSKLDRNNEFNWNGRDDNEFHKFYRWNDPSTDDKIPQYMTSITCAAVLIFSHDESKVYLVEENGKFKAITGASLINEPIHCTATRILREINIDIDNEQVTKITCCGGWNIANRRVDEVNNVGLCYAVQLNEGVTEECFELDLKRIRGGAWFSLNELEIAEEKMIKVDFCNSYSNKPHLDSVQMNCGCDNPNNCYRCHNNKYYLNCAAKIWIRQYVAGKHINCVFQTPSATIF